VKFKKKAEFGRSYVPTLKKFIKHNEKGYHWEVSQTEKEFV
jgi:hypothetical protein